MPDQDLGDWVFPTTASTHRLADACARRSSSAPGGRDAGCCRPALVPLARCRIRTLGGGRAVAAVRFPQPRARRWPPRGCTVAALRLSAAGACLPASLGFVIGGLGSTQKERPGDESGRPQDRRDRARGDSR